MYIRRVISIIMIMGIFTALLAQEKKLKVAVKRLSGKGISESVADIITARLRVELLSNGAFRVMERSEMTSILKEQGFQQSGVCKDNSCLVEAGQILGVDRIIAGDIGKVN